MLDDLVADDTEKHLIHLSLNLEAILGLKGVSTNALSNGISTEDAIWMLFEAGYRLGKAKKLTSVDISDYNPAVEDQ